MSADSYAAWVIMDPVVCSGLTCNHALLGAGDIYIQNLSTQTFTNTGSLSTADLTISGNATDAGGMAVAKAVYVLGNALPSALAITTGTNSTSTSTGSFKVSTGGVGCQTLTCAQFSANTVQATNTTDSSSTTTGCVHSLADVAVTKTADVGTSVTTNVLKGTSLNVTGSVGIGADCYIDGFFYGIPGYSAQVRSNNAQSITNGTWTQVTILGTVNFDTSASSAMTTTSNQITIAQTGYYEVYAYLFWQGPATGDVHFAQIITKNDTTQTGELFGQTITQKSSTANPHAQFSGVVSLTSGDILRLLVYHDHTSALSLTNGTGRNQTYFGVTYLGS